MRYLVLLLVIDDFVSQKLQRRIANARGIAPSVSLSSSAKPGPDDSKQDGLRRGSPRAEGGSENGGVTKRKYRRHPKVSELSMSRLFRHRVS